MSFSYLFPSAPNATKLIMLTSNTDFTVEMLGAMVELAGHTLHLGEVDGYGVTAVNGPGSLSGAITVNIADGNSISLNVNGAEFAITGSQSNDVPMSSVTGLTAALAGKAAADHTHTAGQLLGRYLALTSPPVDGIAEKKERIYLNFTGQTAAQNGNVRMYFLNSVGGYIGDIYVPLEIGDDDEAITEKVYSAFLGNNVILESYTVTAEGTLLFVERRVGETVTYPTELHASGGAVWGPDASRTSVTITQGVPGFEGTAADFLLQEALLTITDEDFRFIYTFRCISTAPYLWEGATSGLIWDHDPEEGSPRWRITRMVGSGEDRHPKIIDLNQIASAFS